VSVTEPSDAVNAGMAMQTEVRRLAVSRKSPPPSQIFGSLVWILRISLTVVRLALCKCVVMLSRFGVRCSGMETVREFTIRDSALGR